MLKDTLNRLWFALSILATCFSVVSLVENWAEIEFDRLLAELLKFYRAITQPVFDAGFALIKDNPFVRLLGLKEFPGWLRDLWTLSIFGTAPAVAVLMAQLEREKKTHTDDERMSQSFQLTSVLALTLLGLPILLFSLATLLWPPHTLRSVKFIAADNEQKEQSKGSLAHLHAILLAYTSAIVAFFALNEVAIQF